MKHLVYALLVLGAQAARFAEVEGSLTNNIKLHISDEGMEKVRERMDHIEATEKVLYEDEYFKEFLGAVKKLKKSDEVKEAKERAMDFLYSEEG
jgi:hypothetical protein